MNGRRLTREEFDELTRLDDLHEGYRKIDRPGLVDILATIEARQGFAPEPVSEAKVRQWVGMMDGLISEQPNFGRDDLALANEVAARVGLAPTLETWGAHPDEHYRVRAYGKSTEYKCRNLAAAARTIAALAYRKAEGADIFHLLGDAS